MADIPHNCEPAAGLDAVRDARVLQRARRPDPRWAAAAPTANRVVCPPPAECRGCGVSELIACTGAPLAGPHAVIAARVPRVTIRDISTAEDLAALEPLWLSLHHHHHVIGPSEHLVNDDATSWERRRAVYEGWLRSGTAIVLVAHLPCTGPAGYLVAHVCQGPDDTFAVGDRYAELYSLSVAPAHRCRAAWGDPIADITWLQCISQASRSRFGTAIGQCSSVILMGTISYS